jgi:large subunit ribosomal protein L10
MNREEKQAVVDTIGTKLGDHESFYMTDASHLSVAQINQLRRMCFDAGVELKVAKNTLIKRAMEAATTDYSELYDVLAGPTYLMFSSSSSSPAKVIKEFRKGAEMPVIKAAYIDSAVFVGDENLEMLSKLKSKEELIGDVILLLQSPIKNVIGALQSSGQTLSGLVKALADRPEEAPAAEPAAEAKEETPAADGESAADNAAEAGEGDAAEAPTAEAADAPDAPEASADAPADETPEAAEEAAEDGDASDDSNDDSASDNASNEGGDDAADAPEGEEEKSE